MKKVFIILSVFILSICLLTGCVSEEKKIEKIDQTMEYFYTRDTFSYNKYMDEPYYVEAVSNTYSKLFEEKNYEGIINFKLNVETNCAENTNVMAVADEAFTNGIISMINQDSIKDLYGFIVYADSTMSGFSYNNESLNILGDVLYDKAIQDIIVSAGEKTITKKNKGGYFDGKENIYEKEYGKWYNPLSSQYVSKGEIGTYHDDYNYEFYGDFLLEEHERIWYTNESKPNPENKTWYTVYYKNKMEIDKYFEEYETIESPINFDNTICYYKDIDALIEFDKYKMTVYSTVDGYFHDIEIWY